MGFLRSDKAVGWALVKLEQLESQSEIREIVEVRLRPPCLLTVRRWRLIGSPKAAAQLQTIK